MAIVIGAGTQVEFYGRCATSANWGYNPGVQRLYCIGEWIPSDTRTFYKPQETLSITIYAPGPSHYVPTSISCADANTVSASISPAVCGGTFDAFYGEWLVNSYSYTKDDATMPGQETWSMTRWKGLTTSLPSGYVPPTYVMRGITEGQATVDTGASAGTNIAGIDFEGTTVISQTGNVSAGGFGKADEIVLGVIAKVGGGSSTAGDIGQGSASMPYTPLYI